MILPRFDVKDILGLDGLIGPLLSLVHSADYALQTPLAS